MDFSKTDYLCNMCEQGSDLVFTRYLYIKEEVRINLLVSLLNKKEDAIFWAYELYYSGFKFELINLIWKIYYDFYATLNPSYEAYLLKKHKELIQNSLESDKIICSIIQDLLFRPFNSDVFMLRNICENFEIEIKYFHNSQTINNLSDLMINMKNWISNKDLRSIAHWILNLNNNLIDAIELYKICLDNLENEIKLPRNKLVKDFENALKLSLNTNVILLAKIIYLIGKKAELKLGKSIYINVEPEDIIPYETIIGTNQLKSYNILEKVYMCGIDDLKHLSLFKLSRNKYNLKEKYYYHWVFHASFSPLWLKRIQQFKGFIDYKNKKVIFPEDPNDDLLQEFYSLYGLEPDEQKSSVQDKSIQVIEKKYDWIWFYEQYKKNGLCEIFEEELEEFNNEGLKY